MDPCPDRVTGYTAPPALAEKIRLWVHLKFQAERTTTQLNQLRDQIAAEVDRTGYQDESGHIRLDIPPFEFGGKRFAGVKRERRVSRVLHEDRARALAEKYALTERLFPPSPMFDQDELYVLYQQGLITEQEIDELFETRVSWAFKTEATPL